MLPEHKNPIFVSKRPKISEKSPILTQKCRFCAQMAFPMVGLIHSFNKYGRPASLYDLFWSPVWVLYSELWLPNRYHRNPLPHPAAVASSSRTAVAATHYHRGRGYSFRPLMASRSLVSISSASSGLSSRTFFTPSRPWASLLSL